MTNHRRGFLTKEAAEDFQLNSSTTAPYSSLVTRQTIVTDYLTRAGGRIYVYEYAATIKGKFHTRFGSYIGA